MRRMLPVILATSLFLVPTGVQVSAALHSIGPGPTIEFRAVGPGPGPLDFKKQDIPKIAPALSRAKTVPNLDPLIDQLIRYTELNSSATKLMPWVYTTTTETVVADYEEAVTRLEFADECLQQAMWNMLQERTSLEADPMLVAATTEMDNAEFTILLLVEIAKLEL